MKVTSLPPSALPFGYGYLIRGLTGLQSPLLLALRLYWGWQFSQTGWGKLTHLERTTQFFQGLGIPYPEANVILAGTTEWLGGLFLLAGLASRLVPIPLLFTLIVAYLTADRDSLNSFFSDPDKFVSAAPFEFMLAAFIIWAFGPGTFSLDYLIGRYVLRLDKKVAEPSP